jgi:hypothetical protein
MMASFRVRAQPNAIDANAASIRFHRSGNLSRGKPLVGSSLEQQPV